ncbi:MAG: M1 family peptidase [Bacteroidetes bacterium]|nr:M1 family peptidase [Bacteroidota bacterium]
MAAYTDFSGWQNKQYLGSGEFALEFGDFLVRITAPDDHLVASTGKLLNADEVLTSEQRDRLAKARKASQPVMIVTEKEARKNEKTQSKGTKTWIFKAEMVRDFAFASSRKFIWDAMGCEIEGRPIMAMSFYPKEGEPLWSKYSTHAVIHALEVYSKFTFTYPYPVMISVNGPVGGMEYPMITLDGGSDPGYRGLFAHEIGHNWFFGIVGNNETYRAALDEGFTQFLTAWCVKKIDGEHIIRTPIENKYVAKFKKPTNVMDRRIFGGYMGDAMRGDDATLNTHSSAFNGALRHGGGYRHVYYKTATMLYNLEYVLGDELFRQAMSYYYNTWKIAHPYFNDFRDAIIHYTKADLNWFFDQWMETTKRIDYSVKSVKKGKEENEYVITFLRKERMQMPIDFRVTARDGKTYDYYIPNTWFKKETNATILPKWYGWDKLQPTYEAHVIIPGGIKDVMIDPSQRLADINLLDNSKKVPVTIEFDHQLYNSADRHHYEIKWRPDIWYNSFDGIKAGLHANGHYMNYRHIFSATVWYNTGVWQGKLEGKDFKSINIEENFNAISFNVDYKTPMNHISKHTELILNGRSLDGLNSFRAEVRKETDDKNTVYAVFKSMSRLYPSDTTYLLHPQDWGLGKYNNTLTIGLQHDYRYTKGRGKININLLSSALISDYDYSNINMTSINSLRLKKLQLRTRIFGQYGAGSNRAPESDLYFAGASPEEMMDNKYVRSAGFIPASIAGFDSTTNNFHHGGGLNMRGYAGYYVVQGTINEPTYLIYRGSTGFSVNAELEFNRYIPFNPRFLRRSFQMVTYLFGDAGIINFNAPEDPIALSDLRVDAGVGLALTIKRFWRLEMIDPLTLRFDMPFFLNRIPATDDNYLQFRWVIGVDRAF